MEEGGQEEGADTPLEDLRAFSPVTGDDRVESRFVPHPHREEKVIVSQFYTDVLS